MHLKKAHLHLTSEEVQILGLIDFYKEFGAEFVPRARLVAVAWWLRPVVWALSPFVESAKMLR